MSGISTGQLLMGLGAAVKNEGPQYLRTLQQDQRQQEDRSMAMSDRKRQELEFRQKAMYQDGYQLFNMMGDIENTSDDNLAGMMRLLDDRMEILSTFPDADPKDTLAVRDLVQRSMDGDPTAYQPLVQMLHGAASTYQSMYGSKPDSEENALGQRIYTTGPNAGQPLKGFEGTTPVAPITPHSETAKLYQDMLNGLISQDDYASEITRIRGGTQIPAVTDLGRIQQDLSNGNINQSQYDSLIDAAIQEQETTTAADQAKVDEQKSRDSMIMLETQRVAELAAKLLGNESGLAGATGPISSLIPSFRQGTVDFEADIAEMKDLLTMTNLGRMTGVLSETDIKLIANAASGVNERASEGRMKEKLTEIYNRIAPALIAKGITPPPLPGAGSNGRVERAAGGQGDIFSQADAVLNGSGY